jgi:hypothetical protein
LKSYHPAAAAEIQKQWNTDLVGKLIGKDDKGRLPSILASVAVGNSQTGHTQMYEIDGRKVKNQ